METHFENGNNKKEETITHDTIQNNEQSPEDNTKWRGDSGETSNGCRKILTTSRVTNAVAFHIPTGKPVCRPPPKRFCDQTTERENISLERLTEKQRMAERRKRQQVEQRLKRIHDRQEAARKLAHNVELLLQQKSLVGAGRGPSRDTPKMTSSELLATARHVAKDFRTLTSQMTKDLAVDDKNNNLSKDHPPLVKSKDQKEKQACLKTPSVDDSNKSIAFTVGFDEERQPLSPVPKVLQKTHRKDRSKLTAQELDEKQRRAMERRNKRQEERVKRVVANREALFKLASDLETLMIWNSAEGNDLRTCNDGEQTHQAAQLASEIADSFDRLSQRYSRDLKQAEGFPSGLWGIKQ